MRPTKPESSRLAGLAGSTLFRLGFTALLLTLCSVSFLSSDELASPAVVQGSQWALYDVSSIRNFPYCLAYENSGYSLEILGSDPVSRRVKVEIRPEDLHCRAIFPPDPGDWPSEAAGYARSPGCSQLLADLAQTLTGGSRTQYQAVNRVLCWISESIEYGSESGLPSDPDNVLLQRRANCVGAAELAVTLLREAGIPARGVRGFLAPVSTSGTSRPIASREMSLGEEGLHRWIEVYYPGVGWVFSDPFTSVNHVNPRYLVFALECPPEDAVAVSGSGGPAPATFQRLRPEMSESASTFIRLLDQGGMLVQTDVMPSLQAREGVTVRRNGPVQYRPALVGQVSMTPGSNLSPPDTVVLSPSGQSNRLPIRGKQQAVIRQGFFSFIDVKAGEYRLHFFSDGRSVGQTRAVVHFPPRMSGVVPVVLGR